MADTTTTPKDQAVAIGAADLPLHCPTPDAPLWRMHPRVFLDVGKEGKVMCPYCGTRYVYVGDAPKGH